MGLAERKAVNSIKEGEFKDFEAKVKSTCGFEVKITMDWSSLENNTYAVDIAERKRFSYYAGDFIISALQAVCSDNMGKEAVKSGLKEIHIFPAAGDLDFTNGILTVRNDLTGNGAYGADQIQAKLESGL